MRSAKLRIISKAAIYKGDVRGFTLIELLVVLVILGLLAAIVVPTFTGKTEKAKIQSAKTQIQMLGTALDLYNADVGGYPSSLEELLSSGAQNWDGPYLKKDKIPKDPWGSDYSYEVVDNGRSYRLSSQGSESSGPINSWE
ncbi:MAG: type II secretion system major pseudopilin GspG [Candidatus Coatesbacteria bacterium]|nr:type II secretion system major pseudopilin GspG [Candidatus Coatesbacteria bacterium]